MVDFQILFPDEREKGETTLRQCQLVMLRMLKIFDYLCVKYDIKYFLTGGTLLGAVRHQGFIPWDDDLDVGMTRDNYEKFVELAVPHLPHDIFFQTPQTDHHYPQTANVDARLRDKYSSYIHSNRKKRWHDGLQVDIFVYDCSYLPHNFFVITSNKLLLNLNSNEKRAKVLKWIAKWVPLPFVYSSNYLQHYGAIRNGTYITVKEYSTLIRAKFEDTEVYIPKAYDTYLRRQYGDYMQLPPIEKRIHSHGDLANPFKPCDHNKILHWSDKNTVVNTVNGNTVIDN